MDGTEFVTEILQAAPAVQVVVTSRERLNLSGEAVYTVGGMIFPDLDRAQLDQLRQRLGIEEKSPAVIPVAT